MSDSATPHFSQAVNCRTRLELPEPYSGNAIYGVKASLAPFTLAFAIDGFDALWN